MKYLKLFDNFSHKETEFNKFRGIDISDIHILTFGWSNIPFIHDYKMSNDKYGSSEKRIEISEQIRSILSTITKEQFRLILEKNFNVTIRSSNSPSIESISPSYSVVLEGQDVISFFEVLENIKYYID